METKASFDGVLARYFITTFVTILTAFVAHADYPSTVLVDGPLAYFRLSESGPATPDVATNSGSLGTTGNGIHHVGVIHPVPGALVGSTDTAASYTAIDPHSNDGGSPTLVPLNAALNPRGSFTIEAWLMPTVDGNTNNAQCPMINRFVDSAGASFGWDFFQRPSGTGWNFRMFNGTSGSNFKFFDITGGPYTVNAWSHFVAVYDATARSLTLYLNGAQVAQKTTPVGNYSPNTVSPLAIGSFPDQLSGNGYENPFVGSIDEWALYTNALSAAQVLNHYNNGINPSPATPYNLLITSDGAVEYLRLDEPAHDVAINSGSLGAEVNGQYAATAAAAVGPQPPADAGFDPANVAQNFNGNDSYIELVNSPDLNISGAITLEAWIQPAASQNFDADIISHGGNSDFSGEVILRIENGIYQIGSNGGNASYPVPAGDLGGTNWVHLVGTYDGFQWNLYRNSVLVAIGTGDFVGAFAVNNANWAIGARGRWSTFMDSVDRQFHGGIDEPAIYNFPLSASQIQAHYFTGKYATLNPSPEVSQAPVSLTRYIGGSAVLSVGVDSGSPVSYQWNKNGSPIPNANGSALTLANLQLSDAGSYNVSLTNSAGNTNSPAAVLTVLGGYGAVVSRDQPVAYYPMNESSGVVLNDSFSGTYNGTYQGNPIFGTAGANLETGPAVAFNGSSQDAVLGNPDGLNFAGQITLEAWIKPLAFSNDRYIFGHGATFSPAFQELYLRIEGSSYQVGTWTGVNHLASFPAPAIDSNTWVYLAGTYDGTNWNLYRNGTLVASHADSGAIQVNGGWAIADGTLNSNQRYFFGSINEAAIYNYALTTNQILTHYTAGIARPLTIVASSNSVTLTWAAGTLQAADAVSGPYADVAGAASPYVPPPGSMQKFYRLKF